MPSVNPHMPANMYKTYASSGVGIQDMSVIWIAKSTHRPEKDHWHIFHESNYCLISIWNIVITYTSANSQCYKIGTTVQSS